MAQTKCAAGASVDGPRFGRHWWLAMILLLAIDTGCGRPAVEKPPLYPVSGRVTFNGQPAAGISVNLHPVNGQSIAIPSATSGPDGSFDVGTYAPGDGAPEGDYAVTAAWRQSVDPSGDAPEVDRLGGRYGNPATSNLKVHVSAAPNTLSPFQLR
jgi:hypothetical protein